MVSDDFGCCDAGSSAPSRLRSHHKNSRSPLTEVVCGKVSLLIKITCHPSGRCDLTMMEDRVSEYPGEIQNLGVATWKASYWVFLSVLASPPSGVCLCVTMDKWLYLPSWKVVAATGLCWVLWVRQDPKVVPEFVKAKKEGKIPKPTPTKMKQKTQTNSRFPCLFVFFKGLYLVFSLVRYFYI